MIVIGFWIGWFLGFRESLENHQIAIDKATRTIKSISISNMNRKYWN